MGSRFETAEDHIRHIDANRAAITPPKDGAVFYTNGGRAIAVEHAARSSAGGDRHVTLEGRRGNGAHGTPLGAELDAQNLYDTSSAANRAMEDREIARIGRAHGGTTLDKHPAADRVWDHASRTYAGQASGRVSVVTNGKPIKEHGFFARVERPALIRNEKVTHINGVERKGLAQALDKAESAPTPEARKQALQEINTRIEAGDPTRDKSLDRDRASQAKGAGAPERQAEDLSRVPERQSAADRHRAAKAARGGGTREATQRRDKGISKDSR